MTTVHLERMKTDDKSDAFMTVGYRKLILKMFELSLRDMLGKDEVMAKEARNWFDPVLGRDAAVTFEDCVFAMGIPSYIDTIRVKALNSPRQMLVEIEYALQSISRDGIKMNRNREEEGAPLGLRMDAGVAGQIQRAMFSPA